MSKRVSRRQFVKNTKDAIAAFAGAAGVFSLSALIVPRHVLGGPRNVPPSEKLNVAGVGVGGKGRKTSPGWRTRTSLPCAT